MDKLFVGIDVAKDTLDVAIAGQPGVSQLANDPGIIEAWLEELRGRPIALVAFEPTGGFERALRRALAAAGIAWTVVHPNEVVAIRKVRGVKAKTDKIDARLIAEFARDELAGRDRIPAVAGDEVLQELVQRRRQLVDTLRVERCRRSPARPRSRPP